MRLYGVYGDNERPGWYISHGKWTCLACHEIVPAGDPVFYQGKWGEFRCAKHAKVESCRS